MRRRVVDELPSEVALHPANEVVVTRVRSFAVRPSKERKCNSYRDENLRYNAECVVFHDRRS